MAMSKKISFIFFIIIGFVSVSAQQSSSEIFVQFEKFQSLKRVLYIAAHPDDENTRALAWFSLSEKAETAYLSLTRGDGGQNLIGEELGANLGLLRSQELLQARAIDGSRQFFSRAVDFGYSRSADESFDKWNKDEVLKDVVTIIRQFKPDVIIARFPPDERAGHGHHTASSLLAIDAFEKAADANYLPNQVKELGVWKSTALYWNASNWWNKGIDTVAKNNPDYLVFDIGGYNPLLGQSYNEIGTLARSQHKCQGFGSVLERGSRIEYFQHLAGVKLKDSFFNQSTRNWDNIASIKLSKQINQLTTNFDFRNTANNVPLLLAIYPQLLSIKDPFLRNEKRAFCEKLLLDCLGLHIDITAEDYSFISEKELNVSVNLVNRSQQNVTLLKVESNVGDIMAVQQSKEITNSLTSVPINLKPKVNVYQPYWLQQSYSNLYAVESTSNLGKPESSPSLSLDVWVSINNVVVVYTFPVIYKWSDPSYGERKREIISTPDFSANFEEEVVLAKVGTKKEVKIKIYNFSESLKDTLFIAAPKGWRVSQSKIPLSSTIKHHEFWVQFILEATEESSSGAIVLKDSKGNNVYSFEEIKYDHIPTQVLFKRADLTIKKLNVTIDNGKVGYIKGVQEGVPNAISRMGFDVTLIEYADLATIDLSVFKSVVIGIRAYNVKPELANYNDKLIKYVEQGGNLIIQYNTSSSAIKNIKMGPLLFEIGRDRVTEEDAIVTILQPKHPIFNYPNKIEQNDFDDWVQERGLYFAEKYDQAFIPLISWHDKDKSPALGGLIVAEYGKGQLIYTGISFFRQLPSGVEGAYRLFANMLSYQKTQK